jgi:cyclophilin family peptidyl-prolyl cis-trans isomerase
VGTSKRERQKQGRQARIAAAQIAAARRKRLRTGVIFGLLVVALLAVTLVATVNSNDDDGDEDVASGSSTSATTVPGETSTTAEGTTPTVAVTFPAEGETIVGETPCPDDDAERTTQFEAAPPECIDPAKTYTAVVATTMGDFTIELDTANAPIAANNFVVLARYHFYDGVSFHRILPGFVIQAGDPVGPTPGTGGPGYAIADELPEEGATGVYPEGTLAMANSGPNSGGSQFFVTVGDGGSQLDNLYTPFGHVTEGIEVVRAISENGDSASNGTPTAEINIESITITES